MSTPRKGKVSSQHPKVYITESGLEHSKAELELLKAVKRKEVSERIEAAREQDDDEENSEYDAAIEEQTLIETKIAYLEEVLHNAKLITNGEGDGSVIVGSTVKVDMGNGVQEFMIVGKVEANPSKKKISNESPVGSALLGARVGEEIEISTPNLKYRCKVLSIA
jgi:transcription elongation factor GreA